MNECRQVRRLLALREADRSPTEQALVTAHVQDCPDCAAWARQCREQDALISSLPPVRPSPLQSQRFLAQIQTERKRHTMFTQLKTVVNVTAVVMFTLAFALVANFLMPGSLPEQEHLPASNTEIPETPGVQAASTPTAAPYSVTPTPTPLPPPTPTPESDLPIQTPSPQWVTPAPESETYPVFSTVH